MLALAFQWITSLVYMILFGISATLFAIWVIAAGVVLWRRTTPAFWKTSRATCI